MEAAVPAFDAREATGLQHLLAAAFALDGEHAFFHLDVDFLRRHARPVGVEDEPCGFLLDVTARHPLAGHDRGLVSGKVGERMAFAKSNKNLTVRYLAHFLVRSD